MEENKMFGRMLQISRLVLRSFSKGGCIVLSIVLVMAGCSSFKMPRIAFRSAGHRPQPALSEVEGEDALAYGPDVNAIAVYNDYAPGAIRATGGYQSWIETVKIELDCLVTFYRPDGSFYVTEQKHRIYPWSNSIAISANEPGGAFSCLLLAWTAKPGRSRAKIASGEFERHGAALPLEYLSERNFAEGVLELMTAPARLLDTQAVFSKGPQAVRIDGLWYDPVERIYPPGRTTASPVPQGKAVFYQNRPAPLLLSQESSGAMVDIIRYSDASAGRFFTVRGYDYKKIKNGGVSVPRKIDIFRTDAGGVLQQLLATIDYKMH
jgi:hypothetical protein